MQRSRIVWFWSAAILALAASSGFAASNLVYNGSFDFPTNPLAGWMTDYQWLGNQFYMDNHTRCSYLEKDGTRKGILKLYGTQAILFDGGQGIWADSKPIPYDPAYKYRLTLWGRSQAHTSKGGPDCRILFEGYQWKPGVRPFDDPDITVLRKVYRQGAGNILYFSGKDGPTSRVGTTWKKGQTVFPAPDLSDLAKKNLKKVDFLVVHICAIFGSDGDLLVDDVVVEKFK